ncbi:unnamed protein product, partial [Meganyctiphanes norvegica]
ITIGNYSQVAVLITLDNLVSYYITNTYLPTFSLVIIAALTFFFPLDDFTDRIMVSVTALLVEAAFFTQVSSSIPKTAYLKLIDIWCLFCIIIIFFMILVH